MPLLAVMIGSVTFDGASEAPLWTESRPTSPSFFQDIGLSPAARAGADLPDRTVGGRAARLRLLQARDLGAKSVGGGFTTERLAHAFVHTLVPIALAYVAAHYFTLLLFQGQAIDFLASDPLGEGSDLFGTADSQIDYTLIGAECHLVLAGRRSWWPATWPP